MGWGADLETTATAYEAITVSTVAIGFTSTNIAKSTVGPAVRAVVTVETAAVRYRYDGTDPTSSEGHALAVGDVLVLTGAANLAKFKAIRSGGSDGTLRVTYES